MKSNDINEIPYEKKKIEKIGAKVLEAFSPRLYDDISQVLREYVSNSIDANAQNIRISIGKPNYDSILIEDDGSGIRSLDHLENSLSIMMGEEQNIEERKKHPKIGTFGIGFYSGGKICDEIILESTSQGSKNVYYARIPIGGWLRKLKMREYRNKQVQEITEIDWAEVSRDDELDNHYTKITLNKLKIGSAKQLKGSNRKALISKLRRILPLNYSKNISIYQSDIQYKEQKVDLEMVDNTDQFFDFQKIILEKTLKEEGFEFGCLYNNSSIVFDGVDLTRFYPEREKLEPLTPKKWRKKFYHIDSTGKHLVGVGWVVIRGPRMLLKPKDKSFPIQSTGVFETKQIAGVQLRLYNVEILPPKSIWNEFGLKIAHQPLEQIWGEIHLFHPIIDVDLKRGKIIWDTIMDVKKEIRDWLDNILKDTEKRRKLVEFYNKFFKKYLQNLERLAKIEKKISSERSLPEFITKEKLLSTIIENLDKIYRDGMKKPPLNAELWPTLSENFRIEFIPNLINKIENLKKLLSDLKNKIKELSALENKAKEFEIKESEIKTLESKESEVKELETKESEVKELEIKESEVKELEKKEIIGEPESGEEDDWIDFKSKAFIYYGTEGKCEDLLSIIIDIVDGYVYNLEDRIKFSQDLKHILKKK